MYESGKLHSFAHYHVLHQGEEDEWTYLTKGQMSIGCICKILEERLSIEEPRRDRWKLKWGRQIYFETQKLALLDFPCQMSQI
jgi:hypothetical protein